MVFGDNMGMYPDILVQLYVHWCITVVRSLVVPYNYSYTPVMTFTLVQFPRKQGRYIYIYIYIYVYNIYIYYTYTYSSKYGDSSVVCYTYVYIITYIILLVYK